MATLLHVIPARTSQNPRAKQPYIIFPPRVRHVPTSILPAADSAALRMTYGTEGMRWCGAHPGAAKERSAPRVVPDITQFSGQCSRGFLSGVGLCRKTMNSKNVVPPLAAT